MWSFLFNVVSNVLAKENLVISSIHFVNHAIPNAVVQKCDFPIQVLTQMINHWSKRVFWVLLSVWSSQMRQEDKWFWIVV